MLISNNELTNSTQKQIGQKEEIDEVNLLIENIIIKSVSY